MVEQKNSREDERIEGHRPRIKLDVCCIGEKQVIDPTYIMVERWICEASSGTGEVGSGCYLTMIARAMNPGLRVIQKYYVPGRDIGIEHLRQGHYIGGDEKKGFTISEMDISLPDQRLKLFARGRTDWRVENIGKR